MKKNVLISFLVALIIVLGSYYKDCKKQLIATNQVAKNCQSNLSTLRNSVADELCESAASSSQKKQLKALLYVLTVSNGTGKDSPAAREHMWEEVIFQISDLRFVLPDKKNETLKEILAYSCSMSDEPIDIQHEVARELNDAL